MFLRFIRFTHSPLPLQSLGGSPVLVSLLCTRCSIRILILDRASISTISPLVSLVSRLPADADAYAPGRYFISQTYLSIGMSLHGILEISY